MGVQMTVQIAGLECRLTHQPSHASIRTVPPVDNGGDGSSFSPTDLVGAALAACALSTMAIVAAKEGLSFGSATARVEKDMVGSPRRIGALSVAFTMPVSTPLEDRARLEEIARGCPVARSLSADVAVPMSFEYSG
jgi:putative redox protein